MKKITLFSFLILKTFFQNTYAQAPAIEWQKSLGGTSHDAAFAIEETNDGGFVVAGYSNTNDGDITGNHGGSDSWIVKLNH